MIHSKYDYMRKFIDIRAQQMLPNNKIRELSIREDKTTTSNLVWIFNAIYKRSLILEMSNRICFSSILAQNQIDLSPSRNKSLRTFMNAFLTRPTAPYTLKFKRENTSRLRQCKSKDNFQTAQTPLENWLESQKNEINKENYFQNSALRTE